MLLAFRWVLQDALKRGFRWSSIHLPISCTFIYRVIAETVSNPSSIVVGEGVSMPLMCFATRIHYLIAQIHTQLEKFQIQ